MRQEKQKKITRSMMHELVNLIFEKNGQDQNTPIDRKSEFFEDQMSASLPEYLFDRGRLPDHLSKLCDLSGISKSETLKSVIKNDKVELGLLIKIKDYFKELSSKCNDEPEHQIYNVIYFAVIASALLYHDKLISTYTYDKLATSFSRLLKEDWLPEYILKLYREAQEYCEKARK